MKPECMLPKECCGCTIFTEHRPDGFVTRIQHGPNPEHSRELSAEELHRSQVCVNGHFRVMEEWLVKAMAYAHRERLKA